MALIGLSSKFLDMCGTPKSYVIASPSTPLRYAQDKLREAIFVFSRDCFVAVAPRNDTRHLFARNNPLTPGVVKEYA